MRETIQKGSDETAVIVMTELSPFLEGLMMHSYGNYVVQCIIRKSKTLNPLLFQHLCTKISHAIDDLKTNVWGREVEKTLRYTLQGKRR